MKYKHIRTFQTTKYLHTLQNISKNAHKEMVPNHIKIKTKLRHSVKYIKNAQKKRKKAMYL